MSLRQSVASLEYVTIGPITTASGQDPTTDDVDMAFLALEAQPVEGDWAEAEWADGGPPYFAQRLVYGGNVEDPPVDSTVLDAGSYVVWVRIHDNPETPARPVDVLVVY